MDFAHHLLTWYDKQGRKDLPWQQDITPYRVWISEIMLQQTQVQTVIPYYNRFMQRFPGIKDLAAASEDEVLHFWTGLGYYARARNLHKTSKIVLNDYQCNFPSDPIKLEKLPGIGRSTAGAIVSIACQQRAPILDGNVKRVLTRYLAIEGYPGTSSVSKTLWAVAEDLTPSIRVADYTQAIMDLGATVCTRGSPRCEACPLTRECLARKNHSIDQYPGRKQAKPLPTKNTLMLVIANAEKEILLEKRSNQGIWGGLWGFPECQEKDLSERLAQLNLPPEQVELAEELYPFRHTFTHFHLHITPIHMKLKAKADTSGKISIINPPSITSRVEDANGNMWFHPKNGVKIGLTAPVTRLMKHLEAY